MTRIERIVVAALLLVLAGCDSGKWLDVPGTSSKDCADLQKMKKADSEQVVRQMAQGVCLIAGKNYTGDYRCGSNGVSVSCK